MELETRLAGADNDAGDPPQDSRVSISLVAPAYNERENLEPLYRRVCSAMRSTHEWELVLVDDGSSDGTADVIASLAARDRRVRPVYLGRNRGQTAALLAGCRMARAPVLATLDADLQNDPRDVPDMVEALRGVDAVVGYRVERQDDWLRRVSSRVANAVRNRVTGDRVRDTGCALKVFRAEVALCIPPFDGMHRFLPTLFRWSGYRVVERPVRHFPRVRGESKYGLRNRALRAFLDLLVVRWMRSRLVRSSGAPDPGTKTGGRAELVAAGTS